MSDMDYNINNEVKIKLTNLGMEILKNEHEALQAIYGYGK
jgi:hypothetical protein